MCDQDEDGSTRGIALQAITALWTKSVAEVPLLIRETAGTMAHTMTNPTNHTESKFMDPEHRASGCAMPTNGFDTKNDHGWLVR